MVMEPNCSFARWQPVTRTALRAFVHPALLAALGLLIANDHFLKAAAPSALTGKLSDFAGLFLLPFWLIAVLALPADLLGIAPRRTARGAFLFSALWFAALKTLPPVNALTVRLLAPWLGYEPRLLLDPTDLAALAVLPLAWQLWKRVERRPPSRFRRRNLLWFALASWALLATSPGAPPAYVERVLARDGTVYAVLSGGYEGYRGEPFFARSDDFGETWRYWESLPLDVDGALSRPVETPKTVCAAAAQVCFRIRGGAFIERSDDGGRTWEIAWRFPTWRSDFYALERLMPMSDQERPDSIPRDITLLEPPGSGLRAVAALGNQGVLVYTEEAGWTQHTVLQAGPDLPYLAVESESLWYLLGFLSFEVAAWLALSFYLANRFARLLLTAEARLSAGALLPVAAAGIAVAFWHFSAVYTPSPIHSFFALGVLLVAVQFFGPMPPFAAAVWVLGVVVFFGYVHKRLAALEKRSPSPQEARRAFVLGHLLGGAVFLLGALPLSAWAFGWIPVYWIGLGISLLLSAGWQLLVEFAILRRGHSMTV